jgi:hypothetical protein
MDLKSIYSRISLLSHQDVFWINTLFIDWHSVYGDVN